MKELGLNPTESELRDLVNEADLNNDGVISFEGGCDLVTTTILTVTKLWN